MVKMQKVSKEPSLKCILKSIKIEGIMNSGDSGLIVELGILKQYCMPIFMKIAKFN